MALGQLAPRQRGMRRDIAAEQEEGGEHAFALARGQHLGRGVRPRPVIKGQHQFLFVERQGDRDLLAADPWRASYVDRQYARGAERVALAGARLGVGGKRRECDNEGDGEVAFHGANLKAPGGTEREP